MSTEDVFEEAVDMDEVWVMAISLAFGCVALLWVILYARLGKSIGKKGRETSVVKRRRLSSSTTRARNGTCKSPSANGLHCAQASE